MLWKIGIAHGDVSITNLMVIESNGEKRGILNDFDLASVMQPGDRFPGRTGWERTGTIPFMAISLLEFPGGIVKRWYKHDLESFAWCLLWHTLNNRHPSWLSDDFSHVQGHKALIVSPANLESFFQEFAKPEWMPYFGIIGEWFSSLQSMQLRFSEYMISNRVGSNSLLTRSEKAIMYDAFEAENEDVQHIHPVVLFAKSMEESKGVEVLEDITWIECGNSGIVTDQLESGRE